MRSKQSAVKCPSAQNESHRRGRVCPDGKRIHAGSVCVQSPKKAPAATKTPTMVALMPATLTAPLLPPLKEPEGVVLGEVLVDEPDPLDGVDVPLMVEPKPEVEPRELCIK